METNIYNASSMSDYLENWIRLAEIDLLIAEQIYDGQRAVVRPVH